MIVLVKLVTGEMIIAKYHGTEEVNSKKNITVYNLGYPMIVSSELTLSPWLFGMETYVMIPVPVRSVLIMIDNNINPVLLEHYERELETMTSWDVQT